MGWSISPSDGASINSSGVATFTKDGTFTITYTDSNGCTGSTTYTASGCGGTCDCSGVHMTASITATSEEGSEGAEGASGAGTFISSASYIPCKSSMKVSRKALTFATFSTIVPPFVAH